MFDFGLGSSELLLVAIIALIVIGPKDLPRLLRTMGQYMRKIQGMAREFQNHLNEAAKEAGVDDVKKEVKGMTNFTVTADLDKQGAEIKKAIESGAPKPANGSKAEARADAKTEPTRIEAGKSPPKPDAQKPGTERAGTKAAPKKAAPGKAAPKKAAPKATPKSAAARKSPAKPHSKPQSKPQNKPKAARAAEAVKS
jgi:sec-independent protein translocase protein TatB